MLASTFGLSRAEARLAARIGRAEELKDIADSEGITFETARARLKAVFAKTGTHRQAELAVLVASISR
jgi:DNA-binding CsgD family transcriptional regulator